MEFLQYKFGNDLWNTSVELKGTLYQMVRKPRGNTTKCTIEVGPKTVQWYVCLKNDGAEICAGKIYHGSLIYIGVVISGVSVLYWDHYQTGCNSCFHDLNTSMNQIWPWTKYGHETIATLNQIQSWIKQNLEPNTTMNPIEP